MRRGRRRNNGRISERQRKNLLLIYMRNTGRVNTENTSMASVVHPFFVQWTFSGRAPREEWHMAAALSWKNKERRFYYGGARPVTDGSWGTHRQGVRADRGGQGKLSSQGHPPRLEGKQRAESLTIGGATQEVELSQRSLRLKFSLLLHPPWRSVYHVSVFTLFTLNPPLTQPARLWYTTSSSH